jgi:hypothetical protein
MEERTGTGITPERTGLSDLESQDKSVGGADRPESDVGGYGGSSGYAAASGSSYVGGSSPSVTSTPDSSQGSGTVAPASDGSDRSFSSGSSMGTAKEHVERVRGLASDRIHRTLEGRKSHLASELDNVASVFEDVGRTLEERGRGGQKKVVDSAVSFTRRASRMLRDRSSDEILDTVRSELRDRPAALFAGALALGFLGVRFLKD